MHCMQLIECRCNSGCGCLEPVQPQWWFSQGNWWVQVAVNFLRVHGDRRSLSDVFSVWKGHGGHVKMQVVTVCMRKIRFLVKVSKKVWAHREYPWATLADQDFDENQTRETRQVMGLRAKERRKLDLGCDKKRKKISVCTTWMSQYGECTCM